MIGRIFWIALFLIGLSWIVNFYYAYSKQLDEPIFLDHYLEQSVDEGSESYLTLYYLTNKSDASHVSHVNFGGITGYIAGDDFFYDFDFNENEVDPDIQTFTHYALRSVQIDLNSSGLEELLNDEVELIIHEMEIFFSDGRDITVPIGEVVLHKPDEFENVLSQPWVGSNSDNLISSSFSVEEPLTIDSFTFDFDEVLKDYVFIKIDSRNTDSVPSGTQPDLLDSDWNRLPGIEIKDFKFPFELKKDEGFRLHTQVSPEFIGSLESSIIITGATESGKPFTFNSPVYNQQPYLGQKDVDRIIQEKGGPR